MTMREYCAVMDRFREHEEMNFLRAGIVASTIANCNRDPEKTPRPFTPQDFMPTIFVHKEEMPELSREEQEKAWLNEFRVLVAMTGGKDDTRG